MNLFINTISTDSTVILFDNDRQIIDTYIWLAKGNESSTLIPSIDNLLTKNNITYSDLENIVLIHGPGSFTGVRTNVLVVNSINYIIKKDLTALSFFELYNNFPIVKSSSKRDCFVQKGPEQKIEIIPNKDLLEYLEDNNISKIYGDSDNLVSDDLEILEKIDYSAIIREIKLDKLDKVEPLYIKKPNIS